MKEVFLKEEDCLSDEETAALKGTFLTEDHYNYLANDEDVTCYKPNGEILFIYRKKVLPHDLCEAAWPALRTAAVMSQNRGMAAGILPENPELRHGNRVKKAAPGYITATRARPLKKDGTVSNTNYAQQVESGIIGFFDRNARFPFCRQTAFLVHQAAKWDDCLPFIKAVDAVFKQNCPDRYAIQKAKVEETSKDFVIHGTAFTTVTVNKMASNSWRTAVHQDKGDLKEGFGVMSAFCAGKFKGCYLCFPKFKVAADLRTRDVILADVHEWHGNTPVIGIPGKHERISCVFYMRKNMVYCGNAEEEGERARNRKRGDKVNDKDDGGFAGEDNGNDNGEV